MAGVRSKTWLEITNNIFCILVNSISIGLIITKKLIHRSAIEMQRERESNIWIKVNIFKLKGVIMKNPGMEPMGNGSQEVEPKEKIVIYENNKEFKDALVRALEHKKMPPTVLLGLQYSKKNIDNEHLLGGNYDELGEIISEKVGKENMPLIINGTDDLEEVINDPEFKALFYSFKKIGYLKTPFKLDELKNLGEKLSKQLNFKDEIGSIPAIFGEKNESVSIALLHDLRKPSQTERVIDRTNEVYGTNFDYNSEDGINEVEKFLKFNKSEKRAELSSENRFFGKKLPGVFCDIAGTLVDDKTQEINQELLDKLNEYDKSKIINLWTDGDVDEWQKYLVSKGIQWKVLPKDLFQGAKPEICIDDMEEKELKEKFDFKPETFIQI